MGRIHWTPEAVEWLKRIHDYIAEHRPLAAVKVVRGIHHKAQLLRKFPEIGLVFDGNRPELRLILYGHYRIVYRIAESEIEVIGVFHGAMNIDRYLP